MRKNVLLLLAVAIIFAWQNSSWAAVSAVDALIQKLEDKGILTTQEANQIEGEIASQQKASQEATYKTMIPDWVSGLKIGGDFRLRDQLERRKVPGGTSTGNNLVKNRGRFRIRLNFEDQINDKVKIGATLATEGGKDNGTLSNQRSNNVSFGGNGGTGEGSFAKSYIAIDKAWATYTPNQYISLTGGKMANPIWEPASLLWDPNITPEGGVVQLQKRINDYITPFSNDAIFVLKDNTPSAASSGFRTDPYLVIFQEGVKGNLTEKLYYKVAPSYYYVRNPNHIALDSSNSSYTNTLNGSLYNSGFNLVGGDVELGINDPFGELLPSPINIPQIGVFGAFYKNVDHQHTSSQNKAWMIGGYMGNSAINGWGTWRLNSYYKTIERDAWLDVFPDADFYGGFTDVTGWRTQLEIGLMKNTWISMTYFRTNVFKANSAISAAFSDYAPESLFQMDVNFKF